MSGLDEKVINLAKETGFCAVDDGYHVILPSAGEEKNSLLVLILSCFNDQINIR